METRYISLEAAINEIKDDAGCDFCNWKMHGLCISCSAGKKIRRIELIPAADVRPVVRGAWSRIDYEPCGHDYICSECGCKSDGPWNFCHDCGADMRKVVEIDQFKEDGR